MDGQKLVVDVPGGVMGGSPVEEDVPVDEEVGEPPPVDRSPGPPPAPISRRKKDVKGLRRGLAKVRAEGGFFGRLKALFSGRTAIDPAIIDELEEILLTSDVGVNMPDLPWLREILCGAL